MTLKLYNSLTNKLEDFKPVKSGVVRMYNCGPTVYSYAHIGNFRSYIVADLLRRFLEYKGLQVIQVMNITDVGHLTDDADEGEDKLEKAAKKEKKHPLEIAKFYTEQFLKDWNTLNLEEPEFRPKATDMIQEIIALINVLLDNKHAYSAGDNIYFDITTFPDYGKLSGNTLDKLSKHRVAVDANKRNPQDFVLWFNDSKFKNHILKWDSPWGQGYPGWHVECSVMSAKFLSDVFKGGSFNPENFNTIDIHTGGEDNKFPHHECEIAQSEGAFGKKYVNYWLHIKHLMSEGEKMSKSLGNVYNIVDLVDEGFSWRAIRYLLLSTQYRASLNFTKAGLKAAQASLDRIDELLQKLDDIREDKPYDELVGNFLNDLKIGVERELDNDLNMSGALGVLFEFIKQVNTHLSHLGKHQAQEIITELFALDKLFGFLDRSVLQPVELPEAILDLLEERLLARQRKDWSRSDELRDKLKESGFEVRDTSKGQVCKRV